MTDDTDELEGIDLQRWQVPPPPLGQRQAILSRALVAAPPPKRVRRTWLFVALALGTGALLALVAFVVTPPRRETVTVLAPAGGSADADIRELVRRLEAQQRDLERRLQEVKELQALAERLTERIRQLEARDPRDPQPKKKERTRVTSTAPAPGPSCSEVDCVLNNYMDACCAPFRQPRSVGYLVLQSKPSARVLVDGLDTGRTTPIGSRDKLELTPGKHKVTFIIGDDRFTYPVVVKAGETSVMVKDFSPPPDFDVWNQRNR